MATLDSYLSQASLWLILIGLALSEVGLPLPETVFVVAAGVVSQRAGLPIHVPIIGCCMAVLLGDLLLFYLARAIGPRAVQRRPLRWLLSPRTMPRIDALFARHGSMAIFAARFISGVRAATFVLAGMRQMRLRRFLLWDGLAILATVPIFAVLGWVFSTSVVRLQSHVAEANRLLLLGLLVVVAGYVTVVAIRWQRNRGAQASGDAAIDDERQALRGTAAARDPRRLD
jgi:membrane protein DedA with SNARE-associated domain